MNTTLNPAYERIALKGLAKSEQQWNLFIITLMALDAVIVVVSLGLAYLLRVKGWLIDYHGKVDGEAYLALTLIGIPIWIISFALLGLYKQDNLLGGVVEYKQVAKGCTVGVLLLIVVSFFIRQDSFEISRLWMIIAWLLSLLLIGLERFFARHAVYHIRKHNGWLTSRVLIVGANDQGVAIAEQWMQSTTSGMNVIGFLDDFKSAGTVVTGDLKVLGRPTALAGLSHQLDVDEVVVVSSATAWETFGEIVTSTGARKDYTLRLSPGFYELLTTGVVVTNKTFVPLLTIHENRIVGIDAALKAILDYGLGSFLLVITFPFYLLFAAILKLKDPKAPIEVRHQVVGRGGKPFPMLKLNVLPVYERRARRSYGRFEHWLYKTGLDKLPQLRNVLRGQMSLVGPRPRVVGDEVVDFHKVYNLQAVNPGIVGPWVRRDHLKSPDETHDDLFYVRNWQIWLDMSILFQGVMALVSRMFGRSQRAWPAREMHKTEQASTSSADRDWSEELLF
jgi:lipopolysaccharide/colanic/teichoic acid biosynthesis glycosyltransferase